MTYNNQIKKLIKEIEFEISEYEGSNKNMNNEGFYGNKADKFREWIKQLKDLLYKTQEELARIKYL